MGDGGWDWPPLRDTSTDPSRRARPHQRVRTRPGAHTARTRQPVRHRPPQHVTPSAAPGLRPSPPPGRPSIKTSGPGFSAKPNFPRRRLRFQVRGTPAHAESERQLLARGGGGGRWHGRRVVGTGMRQPRGGGGLGFAFPGLAASRFRFPGARPSSGSPVLSLQGPACVPPRPGLWLNTCDFTCVLRHICTHTHRHLCQGIHT